MNFTCFYGLPEKRMNITSIVIEKCKNSSDNWIYIPTNDFVRATLFSDPVPGKKKNIYVHSSGVEKTFNEYERVYINVITLEIISIPPRLAEIHNKLSIDYGMMTAELPEQMMVAQYLKGTEKVLEIGGNIGRNSVVIASILNAVGNKNLVVLECDPESVVKLEHNRDKNGLQFYVEPSALSKRKWIQRGWDLYESEEEREGFKRIQTIPLDKLREKYCIDFDTLVLDCEGGFYTIVMDMPDILDGIHLIIVENDYPHIEQKRTVDSILRQKGFLPDYQESCYFPGTTMEFYFFEVWRK
jgi:FkbM family methyltransferase